MTAGNNHNVLVGQQALSKAFLGNIDDEAAKRNSFFKYNDKVFPPTLPGEEKNPAFVCHMKENIKYSPKKMWYIASFVRGMSVEEALKQLKYIPRKGAIVVRETILEAQQLAVEQHNVEYKTNLWVAESFTTKGYVVKGIRRHAKMQVGTMHYRYCHYAVRLEEGPPPEIYYAHHRGHTGPELLAKWMQEIRNRRIPNSL